ncbi:site-specific DNA-methyltransferase [Stutzerimonas nitrititolerans]|uniref:site-specific DNA-methyltransferase n=1 Tax=Stutzerimonas nitrititolerans TaxID=2482751 RepID=UPI0028B01695|nr:site-specific DNA-methyltransferase [Stutzerimonas nitrititolerans]
MTDKPKLELTWIGKDKRPRLEPRILIEDKTLSYRAEALSPTQGDLLAETPSQAFHDNLLIQGDNLLALKALESKYAGQVKCVFIDPPYNTGSAFTHYDDGVEHSLWLTLIRDRLEIIRTLLADDGSLWITIDDNEAHYLKVLCDEVFGRKNFVISIAWQKVFAKKNKALISGSHDHILVYTKNINTWKRNLLPRDGAALSAFKNPDKDSRGPWQSVSYSVQSEDADKRKPYRYPIKLPSGREVTPPPGRHWNGMPDRTAQLNDDNRLWFGANGDNPPRLKVFLSEVQDGIVPDTWWTHEVAGSNQDSKKEMLGLFDGLEPFSTPKPEQLLSRILTIATNPGDLVLDSFAGSGTTGAVSHKMGRRWIMVELGEHCHTHIVPRLKKVIDGEDQGGISKAVGWLGGGGFRYLRLAPSLLKKDQWGNWVINPVYNAEMLAEAMCKHMGFEYAPSQDHFWIHGLSSESDFIYVTTGSLSHDQLRRISDEVGSERTLLICCKAFMADVDAFPNLTLKKIPRAILGKCEWDHDDYSFSINLMADPDEPELDDE